MRSASVISILFTFVFILGNSDSAFAKKGAKGEYIIKCESEDCTGLLDSLFGPFGVKSVARLSGQSYLVRFKTDPGLPKVKKRTMEAPQIKGVQPNFKYKATKSR